MLHLWLLWQFGNLLNLIPEGNKPNAGIAIAIYTTVVAALRPLQPEAKLLYGFDEAAVALAGYYGESRQIEFGEHVTGQRPHYPHG